MSVLQVWWKRCQTFDMLSQESDFGSSVLARLRRAHVGKVGQESIGFVLGCTIEFSEYAGPLPQCG